MALDWTAIPNAITLVGDAVDQYLTALVPLSQKLLGLAVLISGSWLLLKESLVNSPRNALAALMLLLMQAAIALAAILQWPLFAGIVHGLQTELSMALGGGGNAIVSALTPIQKQFEPLWTFFANQHITPPPAAETVLGAVMNVGYYIAETAKAMFVYPVTMLMSVITALLLGLIVAVLGGAIMFAEVSIAIGLVAAPFMIAMNFFPFVNFTLDGVVKFLLGAIMLKLVAMLTALILGLAMDSVFSLQLSSTGEMSARLVAMTTVVVIAAMFLYVAIKVDDIARALMSGGVVGGPGARVVSSGMQHAAMGAGAAGSAAAGGAAKIAGGAARGAASTGIAGAKVGAMAGGIRGGDAGRGGAALGTVLGAAAGGAVGAAKGGVGGAARAAWDGGGKGGGGSRKK